MYEHDHHSLVPLLDGGSIPLVGTGTLFAKGNELADGLTECIYDGYRLIDTAAVRQRGGGR